MDPRNLEDTADNLDRQAADKRDQSDELIRQADNDEVFARDNRVEARSLREQQAIAEARERDAEAALRANR